MFWIARFLAAGVAVTVAGLLSRRFGPSLGGMVLAFPFVIGVGLIFASMDGKASFRETATGMMWGLLPLLCFGFVVLAVSRQHTAEASLLCGVLVWLATAAAVHWLR